MVLRGNWEYLSAPMEIGAPLVDGSGTSGPPGQLNEGAAVQQ